MGSGTIYSREGFFNNVSIGGHSIGAAGGYPAVAYMVILQTIHQAFPITTCARVNHCVRIQSNVIATTRVVSIRENLAGVSPKRHLAELLRDSKKSSACRKEHLLCERTGSLRGQCALRGYSK